MKPPSAFTFMVIAFFMLFVLMPVLYVTSALLWEGDLENAFDLPRHVGLAKNSLGLASGATFFSLIIAMPLAFLLARTDLMGRGFLFPLCVLPLLIPPYIHAIVWTQAAQWLSLDIHNLGGAVFVLTWAYFPFVFLTTFSGLRTIDRNMEEAALLLRGKWPTICRITLPLAFPHVFSGAVFVFVFSLADFAVPDILRVNVYPVEIFVQFSAFYDEKAAAVLSLPLIFVGVMLVLMQKWHMKDRSYVRFFGSASESMRYGLGYWNIPACLSCVILLAFSSGLPLLVLLTNAGEVSNYANALTGSWEQIAYSFALAGSGSLLVVLSGFSMAYVTERTSGKLRTVLDFGSLLPFAVPAMITGISLIRIWNRPVADIIYETPAIIVLGYVARFFPFAVIIIASGMKHLNPHMEEAASLITPKWGKIVWKIILPLLRYELLTGFFIVFILSFGELGTTLLLIPPGKESVPIKIYNLMHYGAHETVNALCLIILAMIFGLWALFLTAFRKS